MTYIKSKIIPEAKPNPETIKLLRRQLELPEYIPVSFKVFEVEYSKEKYYCCLSSGKMRKGKPRFTLAGLATLEALASIPSSNETLFIKEVKLGLTPLRKKVSTVLKRAEPNSKICFIGNMKGDLGEALSEVFNCTSSDLIITGYSCSYLSDYILKIPLSSDAHSIK